MLHNLKLFNLIGACHIFCCLLSALTVVMTIRSSCLVVQTLGGDKAKILESVYKHVDVNQAIEELWDPYGMK